MKKVSITVPAMMAMRDQMRLPPSVRPISPTAGVALYAFAWRTQVPQLAVAWDESAGVSGSGRGNPRCPDSQGGVMDADAIAQGSPIATVNPYTGERVREFPALSAEHVERSTGRTAAFRTGVPGRRPTGGLSCNAPAGS